jgi:hypothetical protein
MAYRLAIAKATRILCGPLRSDCEFIAGAENYWIPSESEEGVRHLVTIGPEEDWSRCTCKAGRELMTCGHVLVALRLRAEIKRPSLLANLFRRTD